jgi:threonine dehydrogenase-like Zn-dependent dehydrogenase
MFCQPWEVAVRDTDISDTDLPAKTALIRNETSVVSAGTELAILSGGESGWAPLPYVPGYGCVGTVVAKGQGLDSIDVGDRVFTHGKHSQFARSDVLIAKVPSGLSSTEAVFARIAQISMVAQQISDAKLGDYVAVLGLGLVGNFAAQLFTLAGCEVIGVDLSPKRREAAKSAGVAHVVDGKDKVRDAIADLTGGKRCKTVVEATGAPRVAYTAPELAASLGEVILLGSPRGAYEADVTPLLNRTHLCSNGCITIKGAHEWRLPLEPDAFGNIRHSARGNVELIFRLIQQKKLAVNSLITHQVAPSEAPAIYRGLRENPDAYLGVVFNWQSK